MPIYEYRCPKGHVFELFQRMGDAPPETCPTCGAGPLERVLYPVAVHFKGSGFYSTDYGRSRKTAKEAEAGGDSKPGETKPGDSKSEPKKAETSKSE
jgi:putative FmdB family regulatory protein